MLRDPLRSKHAAMGVVVKQVYSVANQCRIVTHPIANTTDEYVSGQPDSQRRDEGKAK
jgi:hypothetical protein